MKNSYGKIKKLTKTELQETGTAQITIKSIFETLSPVNQKFIKKIIGLKKIPDTSTGYSIDPSLPNNILKAILILWKTI